MTSIIVAALVGLIAGWIARGLFGPAPHTHDWQKVGLTKVSTLAGRNIQTEWRCSTCPATRYGTDEDLRQ